MFRLFRPVFSRAIPALTVVGLAGSLGCNPLTSTSGVQTNSKFYTALLNPGGSSMTTFSISNQQVVGVALVSVTSNANGNPLGPTMTLALGTPSGATTCVPTSTKSITPGFLAQIQATLSAGTYCVSFQDTNLAEPAQATIRINSSTQAPVNDSSPTAVDVFASTVGPQGSATHEVPIAFNGTTTVTLVSAGSSATIGVAFGAWDGSVCRFAYIQNVAANASPFLTFPTDPGNYCIKVFDVGTLTAQILFTIDTLHP